MGFLYIVRHGQTQWNAQGRMQGRLDSSLTEFGVEQTRRLAHWFQDIHFQAVFSSSAGRALTTANILGEGRNWEIQPMDTLRETALGPWEGKLKAEIQVLWPQEVRDYWENPASLIPLEGMESFQDLETRCRQALETIMEGRRGQNILVVTHGVTSSMILNILENRPWAEIFTQKFKIQTSVSLVDFQNAQPQIVYRGKTDHLAITSPPLLHSI
ncbi:MAG: hypothetical protein A2Z96_01470 [Spirochaetes bacterium GWB1_48_6]|nr:MAG: hypothetical protein A2Z96_01470 [Spirochaetes bacterium GWB1_48_6]